MEALLKNIWTHYLVCQCVEPDLSSSTSAPRGRLPGKLVDASQAAANAQMKTLKAYVAKYAAEKRTDYEDAVMGLTINMLRSCLKIDISEKVKVLYQGKDTVGLSARKCLAIRVTRFLCCTHYRVLSQTVNQAKGYMDWQPLNQLATEEKLLLPGSRRYKIVPPVPTWDDGTTAPETYEPVYVSVGLQPTREPKRQSVMECVGLWTRPLLQL